MAVFHLKYRDTFPVLEAELLNPDDTAHDLTAATSVTLHVKLSATGEVFSRDMEIYDIEGGIVRYAWDETDWTSGPALVVGRHLMEYEVLGPNGRLSFPNGGNDILDIKEDLGQAMLTT